MNADADYPDEELSPVDLNGQEEEYPGSIGGWKHYRLRLPDPPQP